MYNGAVSLQSQNILRVEMKRKEITRRIAIFVFAALLASFPLQAPRVAAQTHIPVNGFYSADKAQRGRTVQAAIVLEIPPGLHINSNRPRSRYSIPTSVTIEAPRGIQVSAVRYPNGVVRRFSFSPESIAVYEGRAVLRFSITIPANQQLGVAEIRARVRYQSCTDDVCYQPETRAINIPIAVVEANETVNRINRQIFGGPPTRRQR